MLLEPVQQIWDRLAVALQSNYDLPAPSDPARLTGGDNNLILAFEAHGLRLVARLSPAGTDVARVEAELRVMSWAAERITAVPEPLVGADGCCFIFDDRVVTVLPFIAGGRADRTNPRVRAAAAHLLAEVHRELLALPPVEGLGPIPVARYDWRKSALWDWDIVEYTLARTDCELRLIERGASAEAARLIAAHAVLLAEERVAAANLVAGLEESRGPMRGQLHGDFYRGNVLMDGERITGLIDWEDTRQDWLSWELGRAAWEFSRHEEGGFEPSSMREFVGDYRRAGGPGPEEEDDLLVGLLRTVQVMEAMSGLTAGLSGHDFDARYLATNLMSLAQLSSDNPFD